MFRFMTATTLVLTAVFYQQSGGADFEPWQRELPDYVRTEAPTPYSLARAESSPAQTPMAAQAATMPAVFVSDSQPLRLASIGGQTDTGLDPALEGMRFATVTNAALGADAPLPDSSTRRDVLPEAARQMIPTTPERQAVLRGTLPATAADAPEASAQDRPAPTQDDPARDLRQVSGDRVNLRAGPGTSYGVLATLDEGAAVEVLDVRDGWLKLKTDDTGRIGWIADWLVSAAN